MSMQYKVIRYSFCMADEQKHIDASIGCHLNDGWVIHQIDSSRYFYVVTYRKARS